MDVEECPLGETRPSLRFRVLAWALVALFAGLATWRLDEVSLWADEGFQTHLVSLGWHDMWQTYTRFDDHPPLYMVLLKAWAGLFGTSGPALMAPSLLCSLGTLCGVLFLGRRFLGEGAALAAGAALVGSSRFLIFTQEIRHYPLLALAYTLGALCLALALRPPAEPATAAGFLAERRYWVRCTCLALLLAMWSDVWGFVLVAGAHGLVLWHRRRLSGEGFPWRTWWLWQAVLVGGVCLEAAIVPRHTGNMYPIPFVWSAYVNVLYQFASGGALMPVSYLSAPGLARTLALAVPAVFLAGAGLAEARRGRPDAPLACLWTLALLPLAATLVLLVGADIHAVTERRVSCILPLCLALGGIGVARLCQARGSVPWLGRAVAVACATAFLFTNAQSTWNWFTDARYQRQDWRNATRYLAARVGPRDAVLLQNSYVLMVFQHYMRGSTTVYALGGHDEKDLAAVAPRHPRIWFVSCQGYMVDPDQVLLKWLAAHASLESQEVFDNIPQPDARIVVLSFRMPSTPGPR